MDQVDYRAEKTHDRMLIQVVEGLSRAGRLDVFAKHFLSGKRPGELVTARPRKKFDVEITFSNVSCVIESKVDSDERVSEEDEWQTERIFRECQEAAEPEGDTIFLFLTYGTSEYYVKLVAGEVRSGAACEHFRHVKLADVLAFARDADEVPTGDNSEFGEWKHLLELEDRKRRSAKDILRAFAAFRRRYLAASEEIDFPPHRSAISLPELAFPVLSELAGILNAGHRERIGGVTVYPVGRIGRVQDSILNLTELWEHGQSALPLLTCGGTLDWKDGNSMYFEVNEDFNLNLKLEARPLGEELPPDFVQKVRETAHRRLCGLSLEAVRGVPQFYQQDSHVLYEWDFGLLKSLDDLPGAASRLSDIVEAACHALS